MGTQGRLGQYVALGAVSRLAIRTRGRTPEIGADYFHQSAAYSQQSGGQSARKGVRETIAKLQDKGYGVRT
jgi:hypothetical protein